MLLKFLKELKTLWEKEKLLHLSNFFFCHNVFKSHLLHRYQKYLYVYVDKVYFNYSPDLEDIQDHRNRRYL